MIIISRQAFITFTKNKYLEFIYTKNILGPYHPHTYGQLPRCSNTKQYLNNCFTELLLPKVPFHQQFISLKICLFCRNSVIGKRHIYLSTLNDVIYTCKYMD